MEKLYTVLFMVGTSFYFRFLLLSVGQTWVKTIAHTSTLMLLPVLTYVITSVISGNIALSLGMVGALSIVRFRNPVRSPLELSVYFGAITLGITASVSLDWLGVLVVSVTIVTISLSMANFFYKKFAKTPFFITSFSEGNNLPSLSVTTKKEIPFLDDHQNLMSKMIVENEITYILVGSDFNILKNLEEKVRTINDIKNIQISK